MLKEYNYIQNSSSLCPECLRKIDAKIIEEDSKIYIKKTCSVHGEFKEILEENAKWYNNRMEYNKPGNIHHSQSIIDKGCPFDCGLCPNHEQHTCVGLIEITNRCNLNCPICYANSSDGEFLTRDSFEKMVDFLIQSEDGNAEILQISGGEPTLHPELISFIEICRDKGVKYLMINTNGIRIAEDIEFVKVLSKFKGNFEIYLQFDGFNDSIHNYFRGRPLQDIKLKAIKNLSDFQIPVTLVTTIERGINDNEIGQIINFGLSSKYIRGISFQPVAYFGRKREVDSSQRITISGIINKIEQQTSGMIKLSDFIPLPCNVDRVAITYLFKAKDKSFVPLLRGINTKDYLPYIRNTFKFDPEDFFKDLSSGIFAQDCCNIPSLIKGISKFIPISYLTKNETEKIEFVNENIFRISITSFVDAYNFDMKSIQKECVHIITPDIRKIPFSSYNLFHRS
jgi:7,8-dihydro-6-hydroxymethylpterin dimethyltransferase